MRARSRTVLAASALLAASCAPATVTVDMNFATAEGFMKSEQGRLRVFQLTNEQLGLCPQLLDALPTGTFPSTVAVEFDSELTSVCAFQSGVSLPDLGEGPHAFVVEMRSDENDLILAGCTIAEVYVDAPNVLVALQPTDRYSGANVADGTPESRCGGGS